MKKFGKKLVLHRETLAPLEESEVRRAGGGYSDVSLCYATQTSPAVCGSTVHTRPLCE
jgi:hypothetical protein